jgi:hypothetical protein
MRLKVIHRKTVDGKERKKEAKKERKTTATNCLLF